MKQKAGFLAGQLVRALLLTIGVSIITFILVSNSPVDPLQVNVGQVTLGGISQEQLEQLEEYWGVNTPPVTRFFNWAGDFIKGDLGVSLLYRQPVITVLASKVQNTLLLMAVAWVCSGLLGFFLGIVAALHRGKWLDRLLKGYAVVMASTPSYWVGLLLLLIFGVWLQVCPIGFGVPIGLAAEEVTLLQRFHHALLPALTLSITGAPGILLHTREKMAEVLDSDYVLFARARGESSRRIIFQHGLRNIALPAMTLQFASIGEIFGGSVLIEQVFSYPGLGQAAVTAGLGGDIPLLMAITVISALIIFAGNLIANILYGVIDPRIGKGGGAL